MKKIYTSVFCFLLTGMAVFSQQAISLQPGQGTAQALGKNQGAVQTMLAADFTPTIWADNAGTPGTVLATGTAFTVQFIDTSLVAQMPIGSPTEAVYNVKAVLTTSVVIPANQTFWAGFTMNYAAGDSAGLVTSADATPGDAPGTTGDFLTAQNYTYEQWSDNSWHSYNDGTNNTWRLDISQAIFPAVTLTSGADTLTTHLNLQSGHTPVVYNSSNGGYTAGQNGYGDIAKAQKFDATMGVSSVGTINSILFWFGAKMQTGTSVNETSSNILSVSNYPNPAVNNTTIYYELKEANDVSISVVDIAGKEVFTQAQGVKAQGNHQMKLDVSALTSGMYFYTVTAGNYKMTSKMNVVK